MRWYMRILHSLNLFHRCVQGDFLQWRCIDCLKIADADPYWGGFPPYNWRKEAEHGPDA